jgi:hypothetical protein
MDSFRMSVPVGPICPQTAVFPCRPLCRQTRRGNDTPLNFPPYKKRSAGWGRFELPSRRTTLVEVFPLYKKGLASRGKSLCLHTGERGGEPIFRSKLPSIKKGQSRVG